jgi:hypothetical protein
VRAIFEAGLFAWMVLLQTVAGTIHASASPRTGPMNLGCAIREDAKGRFLQLNALVRSDLPVNGRYDFFVVKQSETGSSQNRQSGAFELMSEREKVVTTILLDRSALGHYRAELSVESGQGRVSCRSPK